MIVVIDLRLAVRLVRDGSGQSAFELVIVVAVQQIVLAIVLVVHDSLDSLQSAGEGAMGSRAVSARCISITAPGDISARQVSRGLPSALVDQGLQPSAVSAGFGAKHAPAGLLHSVVLRDTLRGECSHFLADSCLQRIVVVTLVRLRCDRPYRRTEQIDKPGKRVAKKTGDPKCHINTRSAHYGDRHHLDPTYSPRRLVPRWSNAHQCERLRDIVTAGPHVAGAPSGECHAARPVTVVLGITFHQQRGRLPAQFPRRLGRHHARVDRKEVAPCRQNVRPPPRRRPCRPRGNEAPVETGQQPRQLSRATFGDSGPQATVDFGEHSRDSRPVWPRPAIPSDQVDRQQFEPFDRVTDRAPRRLRYVGQRVRPRPLPGLPHIAIQRIEIEVQIRGQCAGQTCPSIRSW